MSRCKSCSILVLSIIIIIIDCNNSQIARYDNYKCYRLVPNSLEQIEILDMLRSSNQQLTFVNNLQRQNFASFIIVPPQGQHDFEKILDHYQIEYQLISDDIQKYFTAEKRSRQYPINNWTYYQTLEEIYLWLNSLLIIYPGKVELITAGKSYEGRDILGVKISHKAGRKGVFIESGMHAREWITPATATFIINELLTSTNPNIRNIALKYDFYIYPVCNPDGYEYSHTIDRLWRKTRSFQLVCYGVDGNRNWNIHWNELNSSQNPCDENYAGPYAFSEIETRSLATYLISLFGRIHTYISLHSFGQLLLYPYGYTANRTQSHNDLETIARSAAYALSSRYGTAYTTSNVNTFFPVSGSSIDWVYDKVLLDIVYAYELRPDRGQIYPGFALPPEQIIPTGQETLDSIIEILKQAELLGYYEEWHRL